VDDLTLELLFETGPFRLNGDTAVPFKKTVRDPKAKGC
jgi:hypothetical protein